MHGTLLDAVDVGDRIRQLEVDHDERDIVQASCDDRHPTNAAVRRTVEESNETGHEYSMSDTGNRNATEEGRREHGTKHSAV